MYLYTNVPGTKDENLRGDMILYQGQFYHLEDQPCNELKVLTFLFFYKILLTPTVYSDRIETRQL